MRRRSTLAIIVPTLLVGLTGPASASLGAAPDVPDVAPGGASTAGLTDPHPCPDLPDFTCGTLTTPLDHGGDQPGELDLQVAVADNSDAPRGVLLVLSGGPGQPGVSVVPRVKEYFLPEVLREYQMVMFDQRGTGAGAIDCPALQAATGGSDYLTPPRDAILDCADHLGASRDFYGSQSTVEDIELLRQALGVRTMAVDGVSYGTFTGAHYALSYPHRVSRLVLDSVVPQEGFNPIQADLMRWTGHVLREACAEDESCTTDPAADLAWLIRHGEIDGAPINGTRFMETLSILSISRFDPSFDGIPEMLHAARQGDTANLEGFLDAVTNIGTPADQLSAGLHQATICADVTFPWGRSDAPVDGRQEALDRAVRSLDTEDVWPYDVATVRASLPIAGCLIWPESAPSDYSPRPFIVPETLILQGDRDLFIPEEWAWQQYRHTLHGEIEIIHGEGHGVQGSPDETGRKLAADFLLD